MHVPEFLSSSLVHTRDRCCRCWVHWAIGMGAPRPKRQDEHCTSGQIKLDWSATPHSPSLPTTIGAAAAGSKKTELRPSVEVLEAYPPSLVGVAARMSMPAPSTSVDTSESTMLASPNEISNSESGRSRRAALLSTMAGPRPPGHAWAGAVAGSRPNSSSTMLRACPKSATSLAAGLHERPTPMDEGKRRRSEG